METKNSSFITGLVVLVIGFSIGYFVSNSGVDSRVSVNTSTENHDMHSTMQGMTSGLSGKAGDALDKAFLEEMIVHHEGAVEMAQVLLKNTKRPELVKMGNDIVSVQTKEIEMMRNWLSEWFGR